MIFPEKPFIDIKEPWTKVWEVNVGDPPTVIPVKYSAYPEPSFKWYVHCRRRSRSIRSTSYSCQLHTYYSKQLWQHVKKTYIPCNMTLLCLCRFKNGLPLKDDYRIKPKSDAIIIRGVIEMDAGNYTIVLTNKITKEEQRRSFQLLVNGMFSLFFPPF